MSLRLVIISCTLTLLVPSLGHSHALHTLSNHTQQNLIINTSNTSIRCNDTYHTCNITCLDCRHSNISCSSSNTQCLIHCTANDSCSHSLISAPYLLTPYDLTLQCTGASSCAQSQLMAMHQHSVSVHCDAASCFNLLASLHYTTLVALECLRQGCHFIALNVPAVYDTRITCHGNSNASTVMLAVPLPTCWMLTVTATQAHSLQLDCLESYACGSVSLYPPEVSFVHISSLGFSALQTLDLWWPTDATTLNVTCASGRGAGSSCSYLSIHGTAQTRLSKTRLSCVGTGCGGHHAVASKLGLHGVNFSLDPRFGGECACDSVSECLGDVVSVFDEDELWRIACGSRSCNYSARQVKQPDAASYSALECQLTGFKCAAAQGTAFCANCSAAMQSVGEECCGGFIDQLERTFATYNCTVRPAGGDGGVWYYPVALCLGVFVICMLALIWGKNHWKQRRKRRYLARRHKRHSEFSVNGSYDQLQAQGVRVSDITEEKTQDPQEAGLAGTATATAKVRVAGSME